MANPYTGADVCANAQALLNDQGGNNYPNAVLFPLLKLIVNEKLNEKLIENGYKLDDQIDTIQTIAAVPAVQQFPSPTYPVIPVNLIQPTELFERPSGQTTIPFIPMTEKSWEPMAIPQSALRFWVWRNQQIEFLGATNPVDVLMHYKANMLYITAVGNTINLYEGMDYLSTKLAEYAARFIGENEARANVLKEIADEALETLLIIGAKGRQATPTRRKPYRAVNPIYRRN